MILGLFCVFEWKEGQGSPSWWKLIEVHEQIEEGYVGKERVENFSFQLGCTPPKDKDYGEWVPIPGRLVYYWTWDSGPFLISFNPPTDWPKWIDRFWLDVLKKADRKAYSRLIKGSFDAELIVVEEVKKRTRGEK